VGLSLRPLWVCLYPQENTLARESNLLLMNDGQNLQDMWGVSETLDTLIAGGRVHGVVVAGVYNTESKARSGNTHRVCESNP
jgi:enterochelin esterase-like enzyme